VNKGLHIPTANFTQDVFQSVHMTAARQSALQFLEHFFAVLVCHGGGVCINSGVVESVP
jgi:hypothetical protein